MFLVSINIPKAKTVKYSQSLTCKDKFIAFNITCVHVNFIINIHIIHLFKFQFIIILYSSINTSHTNKITNHEFRAFLYLLTLYLIGKEVQYSNNPTLPHFKHRIIIIECKVDLN